MAGRTLPSPMKTVDSLRISPKYTSRDWSRLDRTKRTHWTPAVRILRNRLNGRFINFADKIRSDPHSGFAILAFDAMLIETLQQFIEGQSSDGQSTEMFKRFLRQQFPNYFSDDARAHKFYKNVRCGLLHQSETQGNTLVRRTGSAAITHLGDGSGFEVHPLLFHKELKLKFRAYCQRLLDPTEHDLRDKFWDQMDRICRIRDARAGVFVD